MFDPGSNATENGMVEMRTQPCTALKLIFQKTGEIIHIDQTKVILGRESFGAEVLGKIPQISRSHCVIELINNQYQVTDLDSFNGTFIGTSKINCKENPQQILNNDDLIFLGRESYLVQLHFETPSSVETRDSSAQQDNETLNESGQSDKRKSVVYRCKKCGKDYDHKNSICEEICRECGTFNEWEEITV